MGLLEVIAADISERCEGLIAIAGAEGRVIVSGGYPVRDLNGDEITRFAIRIEIPATFPTELPKVFDAADRIPRSGEWHMFPNGRCCIGVPGAIVDRLGRSFKISSFINSVMKEYFIGVALKEQGQDWPFGEMKHNEEGLLEYWQQKFCVASPVAAFRLLVEAAKSRPSKQNSKCACGSGKRARQCHGPKINQFQEKYGLELLAFDAKYIEMRIEMLKQLLQQKRMSGGYIA